MIQLGFSFSIVDNNKGALIFGKARRIDMYNWGDWLLVARSEKVENKLNGHNIVELYIE